MEKNKKFAFSFLACLTLAVGTLVVAAKIEARSGFQQAKLADRSIQFVGNEDTADYDYVNNILVVRGNLVDGNPVYMKVTNMTGVNPTTFTFDTGLYGGTNPTEISFYEDEECTEEFMFQYMN